MKEATIDKRFRFIPFRKHDIVEMCIQEGGLAGQEDDFRMVYRMLDNTFHFEFHRVIERLKDAYASVDPDAATKPYHNPKQPQENTDFFKELRYLLEKANFESVTREELDLAIKESALFKIRLQVDLNDYSEVLLFYRGVSTREARIPTLMGLLKKKVSFINYDRVVVYIRFKEDYERGHHILPSCKPGATLLKLFQNVPKSDIEMLFPNTRVSMRLIDKLLIGVPAVVSGGVVLTTKLSSSLILLASMVGFWLGFTSQRVELNKATLAALLAGIIALGGYLWKQFSNFKNRKIRFMQELTRNLYFKNLDNNAGVFHRIANDAEEEECKEALLAYYFLLTSDKPLSRPPLDQKIEKWLETRWDTIVDFEIDDALEKLIRLGLVKEKDGKFTAIPIPEALKKLDERWDAFFSF